jgi:CDP-4-dehydro-6-deoxyglucose reductase, E1
MQEIKTKINKFIEDIMSSNHKFAFMSNNQNFDSKKDTVYYSGPFWTKDEIGAFINTFITGKWLSSGENVKRFEIKFSKKFNQKHSLMVNSGSSANLVMIAALKKYFNWKDGDEIIVSCVGFPTTINPIIQNNLKPVFVDIDFSDLNWDINEIKNKITDKTVAVFSSPVLGNPYDIDMLKNICDDNKIKIIADNCDSLGSMWKGNLLTDYSVASSCSFYPAHHITTCEGGMVSSNNPEIIRIARSIAWWGRDCYCIGSANLLSCGTCNKRFDKWLENYDGIVDHKYVFTQIGYNLKPLDVQGAVGIEQLKKFEHIHVQRRKNKRIIGNIFSKIEGVRVVNEKNNAETSWFGVPIVCDNNDIKQTLVKHLEKNRIQTRNYFAGNILMHPAYSKIDDFKKYPEANKVLDTVFFVGCSPTINNKMIEYIATVVDNYRLL